MFYAGYDTDDLTDRQNHIFHKLNGSNGGVIITALNFLSYSVRKNHSLRLFDNYYGDCDYLLGVKKEILDKLEIDLNALYD